MHIKKINFIARVVLPVFLFSCNSTPNQQLQTTSKEETTSVTTVALATPVTAPETCYALDNGKDKINMEIAINNNIVEGVLIYNYFEKDKNFGTIKGEMHGDTLLATYTFMSEGKESTRDIVFLRKRDELTEGYGRVDTTTGGIGLIDRSTIKFANTFILKKTDCKTDEHGCMFLMGRKWSVIRNSCIDLSATATQLSSIEMKDKDKAPAFLIFSDDNTKAEVYLPENNHSVMLERKGKEGNWTWQHDDFKLIPWKGYVLQKKGVAIYGGM